jgi:hypothetical protein
VENGQLDLDTGKPNVRKLLMTSKCVWTDDLYQKCLKVLPLAIDSVIRTGIVDEKIYDDNDIPDDTDMCGNTHRRDFTIVNEHRQRAKILDHETQFQKRMNHIRSVFQSQQDDHDNKVREVNKTLEYNRQAEESLDKMENEQEDRTLLEKFYNMSKNLVKSYVVSRYKYKKVPSGEC